MFQRDTWLFVLLLGIPFLDKLTQGPKDRKAVYKVLIDATGEIIGSLFCGKGAALTSTDSTGFQDILNEKQQQLCSLLLAFLRNRQRIAQIGP